MTKTPRLLGAKYKTHAGACKRAAFERSLWSSNVTRYGAKPRRYSVLKVGDFYRVAFEGQGAPDAK